MICILAVKRQPGRGRKLSVRVRWAGRWPDSWVKVSWLTPELRREARAREAALFGDRSRQPARPARAPTRRCSRLWAAVDSDDSDENDDDVIVAPRRVRRRAAVVGDSDDEAPTPARPRRGDVEGAVGGERGDGGLSESQRREADSSEDEEL